MSVTEKFKKTFVLKNKTRQFLSALVTSVTLSSKERVPGTLDSDCLSGWSFCHLILFSGRNAFLFPNSLIGWEIVESGWEYSHAVE